MPASMNMAAEYILEDFLITSFRSKAPVRVHCRWRISSSQSHESRRYYHTLNLFLSVFPAPLYRNGIEVHLEIPNGSGTALETLARHACYDEIGNPKRTEVATKVILACADGYLCRSDILDIRMRHSEFADGVVCFTAWNRRISSYTRQSHANTLLRLLLCSPGAIVANHSPIKDPQAWSLLQRDIEMRMTFDWLISKKPAAYKIALVAGRHMYDSKRGTYRAQGFFEAAHALGIAIIVLDEEGHWLQGDTYAHLRHDFVPVKLSETEGLSERLVEAVASRDIDGLVTFTDEYVLATAAAAEKLGLPTEPLEAIQLAIHKHEMRQVVNNTGIQTLYLSNASEVKQHAKSVAAFRYPLILKPSCGRSSAGVVKVNNEVDMRAALNELDSNGLAEDGILIEQFVDGPELDCNFVLRDGKVLFLEVTDDLPCAGDANDATPNDDFFETVMISNSGLPTKELQMVETSLQDSLAKLGLSWGVFHAEARVQNSSMEYRDAEGNGVLDLAVRKAGPSDCDTQATDAFLIEVNVRPPGVGGAWAAMYSYGVDYNALQLLRAVEDRQRYDALSQAFAFTHTSGGGGGAQYWMAQCMIPVHRDNIRVPGDFFTRLYNEVPDVQQYVSKAELHAKPGSIVSKSGGVGLIAYLLLHSRTSRRHVLNMYHVVTAAAKRVLDVNE